MYAIVELYSSRRVPHLMTGAVEIQRREFVSGVLLELVLRRSVQTNNAQRMRSVRKSVTAQCTRISVEVPAKVP